MTVKSVISFPVDDTEFKAFQASFEKFKSTLGEVPEAFAEMSSETKDLKTGFRDMTALILATGESVRKQSSQQKDIAKASMQTSSAWARISTYTRTASTNILNATTSLLKWGGISGIVGGLLGGLGIEHLAAAASAGLRSSTGLGLSYGQQQAFGTTYNRVLDANSFLGGVSQARGDMTSDAARSMFMLGVNPAGPGNTGSSAVQALDKIRALTQQTSESGLGILHSSRGLASLGLSVEDLRRIKSLSNDEFSQYKDEQTKRSSMFNVDPKTLKMWQAFDVQLDEAGKRIKNTFIIGLEKLTGPLGKLTDAFVGMLEQVIGSNGFKWVIDKVTAGLKWFADWVTSDKFKQDIKDVAEGIGSLAKSLISGLRLLGLIPGADPSGAKDPVPTPQRTGDPRIDARRSAYEEEWDRRHGRGGAGSTATVTNDGHTIANSTVIRPGSVPDWLLALVAKLEGSKDNDVSTAGAIGKYQIMPKTGAALGFTPNQLFDPVQNKAAATKLLAELSTRYKGNVAEILLDYNGGPAAVTGYRNGGIAGVPTNESRNYVNKGGNLLRIEINNNTGGNANVTARALAAGA